MTEVIGVRFKKGGKSYYFAPGREVFTKGEFVIVETARGPEFGEVTTPNKEVEDSAVVSPLKSVLRRATEWDIKHNEENQVKAEKAAVIFNEKVKFHGLDMNLTDVEYSFDNNKILFFFTADGRVDFRNLVKDLAGVFKTRIELRQIGVRDEAKMHGGIAICGQQYCCCRFMKDFHPVSIKMAKEQGLSLNPTKITGSCGRLMCCLKYEQNSYDELLKITPKVGALVSTPEGKGTVVESFVLTGDLKVSMENNPDSAPKTFKRDEVKIIRDGSMKINKKELDELSALEKE